MLAGERQADDMDEGGARDRGEWRGSRERHAALLALLSGVLYNTWPLGFVLDPGALHGTYVSVLEAPGRPHAHVFVACDLLAGVTAVLAGWMLRRYPLVAIALVVFGVGTVLEAALPIDPSCATSVASCGIAPEQVLAPHDVASLVSALGLVIGLWSLHDHSQWLRLVIALGVLAGLFMVVSVVVVRWLMLSQAALLVMCGVSAYAVALAPGRGARRVDVRATAHPGTSSGSWVRGHDPDDVRDGDVHCRG